MQSLVHLKKQGGGGLLNTVYLFKDATVILSVNTCVKVITDSKLTFI